MKIVAMVNWKVSFVQVFYWNILYIMSHCLEEDVIYCYCSFILLPYLEFLNPYFAVDGCTDFVVDFVEIRMTVVV